MHDTDADPIARYHAYAAAFEAAYVSDDWSHLEPYFTVDAVADLNGTCVRGRDGVLTAFRTAVTIFDRRFDARRVRLVEGPTLEGGRVHTKAVAVYERDGLPPLELTGEEWFTFAGDRICHHLDRVVNLPDVMAYLARHAGALRPLPSPSAASSAA